MLLKRSYTVNPNRDRLYENYANRSSNSFRHIKMLFSRLILLILRISFSLLSNNTVNLSLFDIFGIL